MGKSKKKGWNKRKQPVNKAVITAIDTYVIQIEKIKPD